VIIEVSVFFQSLHPSRPHRHAVPGNILVPPSVPVVAKPAHIVPPAGIEFAFVASRLYHLASPDKLPGRISRTEDQGSNSRITRRSSHGRILSSAVLYLYKILLSKFFTVPGLRFCYGRMDRL